MYDGQRTGFIPGKGSSRSASVTQAVFARAARIGANLVDVVHQVDLFPTDS